MESYKFDLAKCCASQCEFLFKLFCNFDRPLAMQHAGSDGMIQTFNCDLCSWWVACSRVSGCLDLLAQCKCLSLRSSDRFSLSLYCNFLEEQILVPKVSIHLQFMIAKISIPYAFSLIRISFKINFHFLYYKYF